MGSLVRRVAGYRKRPGRRCGNRLRRRGRCHGRRLGGRLLLCRLLRLLFGGLLRGLLRLLFGGLLCLFLPGLFLRRALGSFFNWLLGCFLGRPSPPLFRRLFPRPFFVLFLSPRLLSWTLCSPFSL